MLDPEELFGRLKIDENESEVEVNHKQSIKTLPCVSSARPSFAWDNAFFTDPGLTFLLQLFGCHILHFLKRYSIFGI